METQAPQEPLTAPATRASSDRQRQLASKKTKASVREGVSRGVDESKLDCDCGTTVGVVGLLSYLRETRSRLKTLRFFAKEDVRNGITSGNSLRSGTKRKADSVCQVCGVSLKL